MVLEAEIDDEPGADRDRRDQEDHAEAGRRPENRDAGAAQGVERDIGGERDERRDAEKVASEPLQPVMAGEAAAVVEHMRDREVDARPQREDGERQRDQRRDDEDPAHRRSHDLVDLAGLPALDAAAEGARRARDRHGVEAAEERPVAPIDSANTVGLTALMRIPRGISIAAARTKLSSAPLTMLADEPATIGASASTPAISVIEPPSR